jgi:mono/diheme cytochrome c family protein
MLTKPGKILLLAGLFALGSVWIATMTRGQFTQNRDTIRVDSSKYPAELQRAFQIYKVKCNECHGLDTSLKPSMSGARWAGEVKRMQAMASSHISDDDAKAILVFLNFDEANRKSLAKADAAAGPPGGASAAAPSSSVEAGRAFYFAQSCDSCHKINGKGGEFAPPLDDEGTKRSRAELIERMRGRRAGTVMPPLPNDTTDQQINDLVDFLLTLKGKGIA